VSVSEPAQTTLKPTDRGEGATDGVKGPHYGVKGPHMLVREALYVGLKEGRVTPRKRRTSKGAHRDRICALPTAQWRL